MPAGWLRGLNNGNHYGVVGQILTSLSEAEIGNTVYTQGVAALSTAYTAEDEAYKRSQKDWNVEQLKKIDGVMDDYMIAVRAILAGYAALPESETEKQTATELLQLWKDFNFKTNDSYSGESSKVINMMQEIEKRKADAEALGIYAYFQKAQAQAQQLKSVLSQRFDELASRTAGELKAAREATDAAVKQVYQVLNSLQVLMPSDTVTTLVKKLRAIEDYAKQYYQNQSTATTADSTATTGTSTTTDSSSTDSGTTDSDSTSDSGSTSGSGSSDSGGSSDGGDIDYTD